MATGAATIRGLGARERATPHAGLAALTAACLALGLLSVLAPTSPTYDPWAWLIWGREVLHLDLNTHFGPSWKPLPVLLTTPLAIFGGAAPALWVALARAGGLAAIVLAFRVAGRLGGTVAGLVAAVTLALTTDFLRFAAVGDSEGLLVALLFVAIDLHLSGRGRAALWAAFGAALLRPESWPFVGLYALWAARRDPALRRLVVAMTVAGLALWFGPELWGSGNALRAGERARDPNPNALAFADEPALEVAKRFWQMAPWPATVGLAAALVLAAVRRRLGPSGLLAVAAIAWLGVVAVMTEAGFSGNARYLIAPVALACLAGGVGLARLAEPWQPRRAALVLAVTVAVLGVSAATRVGDLVADGEAARNEARLMSDLTRVIDEAGGADAVRGCGRVVIGPFQVTALAWRLHLPIQRIGTTATVPGTVLRAGPSPRALTGAPILGLPPGFHQTARTQAWQALSSCS
jgi:hypothetical protein